MTLRTLGLSSGKRKCFIRETVVITAFWMALAGYANGAENGDTVVNIPDPGLESALRSGLVLDKPEGDITIADLESLEVISTAGSRFDIADLTGLEHAVNVWWISLRHNQITDLGPLAGLTKMRQLELDDNQITDLSPLAGMAELVLLQMDENQISDLSPLSGLMNLELIELSNNQISDLGPLATLTSLPRLKLNHNQISDLSPLSELSTHLWDLQVSYNQITDFAPISGLSSLTVLDLRENQISDVSPMLDLENLAYLGLDGNQISDISALTALTHFGTREGVAGIRLQDNYIDISPGSLALAVIDHLRSVSESPISYIPQTFDAQWAGYTIYGDGTSVDTDTFLGWIDVSSDPWVYCYGLNNWVHCPEANIEEDGGWVYLPK